MIISSKQKTFLYGTVITFIIVAVVLGGTDLLRFQGKVKLGSTSSGSMPTSEDISANNVVNEGISSDGGGGGKVENSAPIEDPAPIEEEPAPIEEPAEPILDE
ncbi:MAG: hypothetical protein UT55_C0086G0001, partial [Candidatus Peregrinibacteria bacterium GW2011_GWE2_39_6]